MGKNKKNKKNPNNNTIQQQSNVIQQSQNNVESLPVNNTNVSQNKYVLELPVNPMLIDKNLYDTMYKENIELKAKIVEHTEHKKDFIDIITKKDQTIDELKKENETLQKLLDELTKQNNQLIEKNNVLINKNYDLQKDNNIMNDKINNLEIKNEIIEALAKLNDCDAMSNNAFKKEFRKYFKLSKYDNNIPNIGQFIDDPPEESDNEDNYNFWKYFCVKYPNSDNKEFRKIYKQISSERVQYGAHHNIYNISKREFDNLMKIAIPIIYNDDKSLCDKYRDWLYLFS